MPQDTKTKKRKNACDKGKRGERTICKILSAHFNDEFKRTPSSGAISTIHRNISSAAHKVLAGDIMCPDGFVFSIENKYGYNLDIFNIFQKKHGDKKTLFGFFDQAVEEGMASVSLDGKMIDAPVAERARNLLSLADSISRKGTS